MNTMYKDWARTSRGCIKRAKQTCSRKMAGKERRDHYAYGAKKDVCRYLLDKKKLIKRDILTLGLPGSLVKLVIIPTVLLQYFVT